ncbi:MAG: hypothetical protein E6Q37_08210 [Crocinitomicaceae bacterium]|nr:MAG: hypothetical protein E6Q37_08210 [Crocinitomicaceae bacterium]
MKQRILHGWNFSRILFAIVGISIIGQAIYEKQYFGILFGGYFFVMGLFGLGCASGSCTIPTDSSFTKKTHH